MRNFFVIAPALLLLLLSMMAINNALIPKKEQWRTEALAYIDKMIAQSGDKEDAISIEFTSRVIIQNTQTLEKIKTYINNSLGMQDMTGIPRVPSPALSYIIGNMPWSSYDEFYIESKMPYRLIRIVFKGSDRQELHDYLYSILDEINPEANISTKKERWKKDALAYIDKMIAQSGNKEDVVSKKFTSNVIIQNIQTLEKIKTYINNSPGMQDVTGADLAASPSPGYTIGNMPWSSYGDFGLEYKIPYRLIIIRFTHSDTQEFLNYLNGVIDESYQRHSQ